MKIKGVKRDRCTLCGECILDCPPELYSLKEDPQGEKQVAYEDPYGRCMYCGHCVAVCPADAIDYEGNETLRSFEGIDNPQSLIGYDTLSKFFYSRRSIRRFALEKVTEDQIKQVLEVMRYAPSASNKQAWEFVVVTDPAARDLMTQTVLGLFAVAKRFLKLKWLVAPFLGKQDRKLLLSGWISNAIERATADFKRGVDRILFRAPCVIILHSPAYGHLSGNDAGISLTLGMFAAQSLGLGTCWAGFVEEAFAYSGKLRKLFGIPKGRKVQGVLAIGHPDVHYGRVPERKPLNVKWM
jgi:nitroreductase/NAD-dependent dihydropyrimidine dehydrogenase PreA subunit